MNFPCLWVCLLVPSPPVLGIFKSGPRTQIQSRFYPRKVIEHVVPLIGQAVFTSDSQVKGGWGNLQFSELEDRDLGTRAF